MVALGMSALTIAILTGAVLGNVAHPLLANPTVVSDVQIAQKVLLRAGVALYGLNLSLQQILQVGPAAIVADLFVVITTILAGWWIGYRWLKMNRDTVLRPLREAPYAVRRPSLRLSIGRHPT